MKQILVVSDRKEDFIEVAEKHESYTFSYIDDKAGAEEILDSSLFDLVFCDFQKLPKSYLDKSKQILSPLVVICESSEARQISRLFGESLRGVLRLPLIQETIILKLNDVFRETIKTAEIQYLRDNFWNKDLESYVFSKNKRMQEILNKVKNVAPTSSTVLLQGDTGVGKSQLARIIHQHSTRGNKQFIQVHCGAIPDNLIESELFGHEKGAFTGAIRQKLGKFELAHSGTLFLDEVSTLSSAAQVKLLQALQDSTFQRVGGETNVQVDIRVIAATNESLESLVNEGKFRKDLYYRLSVFPLEILPLCDRPEDIDSIAVTLLSKLNAKNAKEVNSIDDEALSALKNYSWPGNIRELENVLERAYIIETSQSIRPQSLPAELLSSEESTVLSLNLELPLAEARSKVIEDFEKEYLSGLLQRTKGKISETATLAGIGTRQLNKLMSKYGLNKTLFKQTDLNV